MAPFLENPDENPCFGCGPRHARGLRLNFEARKTDDGVDEVVCEYVPKEDEIGWPGILHTGLHFSVLFEASYWAALTFGGRVHVAHGPQTFDQKRLPRVGVPFRARARIVSRDESGLRLEAVSETLDGRPCGTLASGWRTESRSRIEKAGLKLPGYLLEEMAP